MKAALKAAPKANASAKQAVKPKAADAPAQEPAAFNPLWQALAFGVRPKLAVSSPDDPIENEADRLADRVLRMARPPADGAAAEASAADAAPTLRRVGPARRDDDEGLVASRGAAGAAVDVDAATAAQVGRAIGSQGQALDRATREFFEPRFGHAFGQVRVHAGSPAAAGARAVSARAFTVGHDIVFGHGEYAPGQPAGRRLLAHELAHVVQHDRTLGGAARPLASAPVVFRAPTPAPAAGVTPPPAPGGPPAPAPAGPSPEAVKAAASEVVELKGHRTFDPSAALMEMLDYLAPASLLVKVRFGTLADGAIYMRKGQAGYNAIEDPPSIALHHPAFPGAGHYAPPRLQLSIVDSVVTGHVQFFPWDRVHWSLAADWQEAFPLEKLLGWKGLRRIRAPASTNEVKDGVLRYSLDGFAYQLDGEWEGTGDFGVVDEKVAFTGNTDIKAVGVADSKMPLKWAAGRVFGNTSLALKLSPFDAFGGTLSGSLEGGFANGVTNITGSASYKSSRLNGSVTVKLTSGAEAYAQIANHLLPDVGRFFAVPGDSKTHVVFGWGTLDFHFNEWLSGRASVVVDPAGYITSYGEIRPTKQFEFLTGDQLSARKPIGPKVSAEAFKPVWGPTGVTGKLEAQLTAAGRIGPGRIHDMYLSGTFSTNPVVPLEVELGGVVDLSAIGRLELDVTGSLAYTLIGKHVRTVAIEVAVLGTGTLKVYARLEPSISAEKAPGADTQFRLKGVLKAVASASLGLSGSIKPSIFGFGPRFRTGKYEWPLGGIGVKSTLDYRIGDPQGPELDFESYVYDPTEFHHEAERLLDDAADKDKKKHETEVSVDESKPRPLPAPALPPHKYGFTMHGVAHQLWLEADPTPVVQMASGAGKPLRQKLHDEARVVEAEADAATGDQGALARTEQAEVASMLQQTIGVESSAASLESEDKPQADVAGIDELSGELHDYGQQFGKPDLGSAADDEQDSDQKELLPGEGLVGTYGKLKTGGKPGDNVTPHHMPQDKYMAQKLDGNPGGEKWVYSEGICMNMYHPTKTPKKGRHFFTRTYGSKGNPPRYSETPMEALNNDIANVRAIYQKDGLLNDVITDGLDLVRSLNLKNYPKLYGGGT